MAANAGQVGALELQVQLLMERQRALQQALQKGGYARGGETGVAELERLVADSRSHSENAAATKVQSANRGRRARREVARRREENSRQRQPPRAEGEESQAYDADEARGENGSSVALRRWSDDLGEEGVRAATKVQSVKRGKKARKEAARRRGEAEKTERTENPAPETKDSEENGDLTSLRRWSDDLGDKGVQAATKVQSMKRGKKARKEAARRRREAEARQDQGEDLKPRGVEGPPPGSALGASHGEAADSGAEADPES